MHKNVLIQLQGSWLVSFYVSLHMVKIVIFDSAPIEEKIHATPIFFAKV